MSLYASEHQIQNAIIGYLRFKGYYVMRLNSGAMRTTNSQGKQYLLRLAPAGTPDIMAFKKLRAMVKNGEGIILSRPDRMQILFIEVKTGKNKPTTLQKVKMEELESYGARCIVAYSVEDVEKLGI